jgi:uncharacterized protein
VIPIDGQLYLYNAFRRGLYEIEPGVATALARCAAGDPDWAADLPPAWVDLLQAGGFVLDDAVDEHARLRVEREAQRLATHQTALTICPTLDCNFGCPYCFEGDLKPQERMQPGTMDAIVRFIHHLKAPDTRSLSVTWFGGEPLLGMPQIEQLTARLRADVLEPLGWAYSAGMITNGYGLTRKIATTLRALGVDHVQVTLDGAAPYHDARRFRKGGHPTYERIVRNLEEATDLLRITVRVNLDRSNAAGFLPWVEDLHRRGLKEKVQIYPAFTRDQGDTPWDVTYAFAREFLQDEAALHRAARAYGLQVLRYPAPVRLFCGSSRPLWWTIAPNGDLHKCWDTVNDRSAAVGNVRDVGPVDGWDRPWTDWSPFNHPKCQACAVMPLCMGGCAHNAFLKGGEPQCEPWKAGLADAIRVWVEDQRNGLPIRPTSPTVPVGDSV